MNGTLIKTAMIWGATGGIGKGPNEGTKKCGISPESSRKNT